MPDNHPQIQEGLDAPPRIDLRGLRKKELATLMGLLRQVQTDAAYCDIPAANAAVEYFVLAPGADQLPNVKALMHCLSRLAVYYVMHDRRIQGDLERGLSEFIELTFEALRKFAPSKTSGEFGEILLYSFLEEKHGASQALAKMETKKDPTEYVKGADAVHLRVDGQTMHIYWGESKVEGTFDKALASAFESLSRFLAPTERADDEGALLDVKQNQFPADVVRALEAHYKGLGVATYAVQEHLVVFLCFSWPWFKAIANAHGTSAEQELHSKVKKAAKGFHKLIATKFPMQNRTNAQRLSVILLPVDNVQNARDVFQQVFHMHNTPGKTPGKPAKSDQAPKTSKAGAK